MNENREKIIVRTSIIGILVNILLAAFKAVVGMLSHSIAVVMDAVNNLSDAMSSVITILGTKLAGKEPDKKHPLGYGRIEYLSAMIISLLVLYAGITAFTMLAVPNRFTSNCFFAVSRGVSSAAPEMPNPAQFTSTSMRPSFSRTACTAARALCSSDTSQTTSPWRLRA